jgi:hypothetical protein
MSKMLRDAELNYTNMEETSVCFGEVTKALQNICWIFKNNSFCASPTVKDILSQQDCLGTRGKWVSKIQEYDLEIKPTKIIKGQGLVKLMT